jgi:general secretion pathway protein G
MVSSQFQSKSNSLAIEGFTLIEFAIVVLIAALVIGTITPVYLKIIEKKRIDYTIDEINQFQRDINRFERKFNRYPSDLSEIYPGTPIDPWGTPYHYLNIRNAQGMVNTRTNNDIAPINGDYDLFSAGPDKVTLSPVSASESRDDIIRGRNGNFIGIATEFR